ncbi:Rhodanese-like protein [Alkalidesulfovibrio alkalitolerans DSM 16529]|jgi:sodium/bile acid cotransporter 7|uniref:Rhodanese-like protein n=2 Tax=Alkalidesulfovibrio alkalitolerans TaxID=293256 RepID=S7USZ9_9BACT|nr:Rhodanese-like protein [Alkalidesulfovibrio alkalitolerans DSM 16529]
MMTMAVSRRTLLLLLPAVVLLAVAALKLGWLPDHGALSDAERRAKALAMYDHYAREFPGVAAIEPEEAILLHERGQAVFVDVREPREMAVSTIPGALSEDGFLAALAHDPEAFSGKIVIGYCTISYRSGVLAERLAERHGFTMLNLRAGILGWLHVGGSLVGPDGKPSNRVHVYGASWDLAPRGIESIY